MKRNMLLGLSILLMGATAFAMQPQQFSVPVSLGYWKNDTDKNLIVYLKNFPMGLGEQAIAKLPARSEVNLNQLLQLSSAGPAGVTRTLGIRDPLNPQAELSIFINGSPIRNHLYVSLNNNIFTGNKVPLVLTPNKPSLMMVPEQKSTQLDVQEFEYLPAGSHVVIQGTVRGDNFDQSKIELLGVQH